jgi:4'-phosphopantetheinyl transferase
VAAAAASPWRRPPQALRLEPSEVHLFRIPLVVPEAASDSLIALLSPDERERARRFLFDHHRIRFIAGRAALRGILARCVGASPESLGFEYSERGRPRLATPTVDFDFNLAHSDDLGLLAVSPHPVGVDLERLREMPSALEIAARFFSVAETEVLVTLPPGLRAQGFFNAWTRKEALLKAAGVGIGDLEHAQVTLDPGEPPRIVAFPGPPEEAARWRLHVLDVDAGYVAALAVKADVQALLTWEWTAAEWTAAW